MHRTKWKGNWIKSETFSSLCMLNELKKKEITKSFRKKHKKSKNWWLDQWNKIKLKEETLMSWTLRGFTKEKIKKKYRIKECGIYKLFIKHDKEIPLNNLKDNNRKKAETTQGLK